MPVTLSIKNVPDDLARRLRRRAARHHRSLQGELLAILEDTAQAGEGVTPKGIVERIRKLGLRTPPEATKMIRQDRHAHLKSSMRLRSPRWCLGSRRRKKSR